MQLLLRIDSFSLEIWCYKNYCRNQFNGCWTQTIRTALEQRKKNEMAVSLTCITHIQRTQSKLNDTNSQQLHLAWYNSFKSNRVNVYELESYQSLLFMKIPYVSDDVNIRIKIFAIILIAKCLFSSTLFALAAIILEVKKCLHTQ